MRNKEEFSDGQTRRDNKREGERANKRERERGELYKKDQVSKRLVEITGQMK